MKVQIRRAAFETNSSSVHTITICKENTDWSKYVGKTIVLGENLDDDLFWNNKNKKDPITKLNMIWVAISKQSVGKFLSALQSVKNAMAEIGITIDVTTDPENYEKWEYDGEGFADGVYNVLDSREHIINFVFNPDSWYDSYATDCCNGCPYESEIKEGNYTEWYN